MADSWLQCDACSHQFGIGPLFFGCPQCASTGKRRPLEVKYDTSKISAGESPGIWRWSSALPPLQAELSCSLGEGMSPLVPLTSHFEERAVFLKNETANPTWSWKDRPNAISTSVARALGSQRVLTRSTGNQGSSLAAYASASGLDATVFCNPDTSVFQLALIKSYGARVILGGCQERIISNLIREQRFFPCTILCPQAGYSNPYGIEGFKTIAYELWERLNGAAPDRVFVGVGSGDGIYGIWKGFRELSERGQIAKLPRMMGCQAAGANSAYLAWQARHSRVTPIERVTTRARSVAELATGNHALRAVRESDGAFLEVPDAEIEASAVMLRRQGFALELASTLAHAGAQRFLQTQPDRRETWVIIGSGAAVKWPETFLDGFAAPSVLDNHVERID